MTPKIGRYVKYTSNRGSVELKKIITMREAMRNGKLNQVLLVANVTNTADTYNVWEDEVIRIVTREMHPEEFL